MGTTALGRGLSSAFQGALWLHESQYTDITSLLVGAYQMFVGWIFVMLHWGVMPVHVAQGIRDGADATRRTFRRTIMAVVAEEQVAHGRQDASPSRTPAVELTS